MLKLDEFQEQKEDLLLANQKFEYRLKQAQIILNDQHMRADLELTATQHNGSLCQMPTLTAQRSLCSSHSPRPINVIPNTTESDCNLRRSLEQLLQKGSQIKQLENMLSVQRLLSHRSRDGSQHSNHLRSFHREDLSIQKSARAVTLEDDQLRFTFQQKPAGYEVLKTEPNPMPSSHQQQSFKVPQKFLGQPGAGAAYQNTTSANKAGSSFFIPRIDLEKTKAFRNAADADDSEPIQLNDQKVKSQKWKDPPSARQATKVVKTSAGVLSKASQKAGATSQAVTTRLSKQTKSSQANGRTGAQKQAGVGKPVKQGSATQPKQSVIQSSRHKKAPSSSSNAIDAAAKARMSSPKPEAAQVLSPRLRAEAAKIPRTANPNKSERRYDEEGPQVQCFNGA